MEDKGANIGHMIAQGEKDGAENVKIHPAPQQHPADDVNLDHAAGGHGPDKQGQGGGHPKQQIQHTAQPSQGHPDPEHPKQVIEQAQQQAQHHGAGEGGGLGHDVDGHLSAGVGRRNRPGQAAPHR